VTTVDAEAVRIRAQEAAEELFDRRDAVLGTVASPRNQIG
jgi:hypothetical protein